jgi:hypothetical protein
MQQEPTNSNPWTRRVLVCVIAASITIAVVDRMRASSAQRHSFDLASSLAVQLNEAEGYGNASIRIGDGADQPFAANSAAVVEALQREIQQSGCSNVILRVSGGVRQGEVQRLHDVVIQAGADKVDVYLALADEQPEIFEPNDQASSEVAEEGR